MTPIPNIPSILDDELFSSWYSRLASANGFESSNAFTNAFLYEMNLGKGAYGDTECDLLYRADT